MNLYLYCLAYPVSALGPGARIALWVSGCPLACKGCITPELWDRKAGQVVSVDRLAERLLNIEADIDGVTLTGGEPFEQAHGLAELLTELAEARPNWNVLAFSGYSIRELHRKGEDAHRLLQKVDVLIAGRYARKRASDHPLIASNNQTLHYLTDRGEVMRSNIEELVPNAADLAVDAAGQKLLVGVIQPDVRSTIHEELQVRPKTLEGTQ